MLLVLLLVKKRIQLITGSAISSLHLSSVRIIFSLFPRTIGRKRFLLWVSNEARCWNRDNPCRKFITATSITSFSPKNARGIDRFFENDRSNLNETKELAKQRRREAWTHRPACFWISPSLSAGKKGRPSAWRMEGGDHILVGPLLVPPRYAFRIDIISLTFLPVAPLVGIVVPSAGNLLLRLLHLLRPPSVRRAAPSPPLVPAPRIRSSPSPFPLSSAGRRFENTCSRLPPFALVIASHPLDDNAPSISMYASKPFRAFLRSRLWI